MESPVHLYSLYLALEIQSDPLILTQDDNTPLPAFSIGNQSKVNPGGLSVLSQRIRLFVCVLYNVA